MCTLCSLCVMSIGWMLGNVFFLGGKLKFQKLVHCVQIKDTIYLNKYAHSREPYPIFPPQSNVWNLLSEVLISRWVCCPDPGSNTIYVSKEDCVKLKHYIQMCGGVDIIKMILLQNCFWNTRWKSNWYWNTVVSVNFFMSGVPYLSCTELIGI